jgi:hypothetical protein
MDLDELARAQHGVVTTRQALDAGLTEDALRWRVASGRWFRVGRGLYRARTGPLDWMGRANAAQLRGGGGSAVALDAAQYLHGVTVSPPQVITVWTPPGREVTRLPGTRFHQRAHFTRVRRKGLVVTSAACTVLDLADAPGCGWREAVATTARWVQHRRVTVEELRDALDRRPRQRHRRVLQLALGVVGEGAESLLEVGYVRRVERRHGLPAARLQVPSGDVGSLLRRDAEYEEWGVVVELDGRLGHEGEYLARDRRRDRRTARTGRVTLRAGWVDVEVEPCELAADVHETLRTRGWTGHGHACGPRCPLAGILAAVA